MLGYGTSVCAAIVLGTSVQLASAAVGAAQKPVDDSPGVIELRKDATGSPEYRELRIDFTASDARWTPVVEYDTAADGWRPAEHFLEMNFSPPLPSVIAVESHHLSRVRARLHQVPR